MRSSDSKQTVSVNEEESNLGLIQILLGIATIIAASLAAWFTVVFLALILGIRGGIDLYRGYHPKRVERRRSTGRIITGAVSLLLGVFLLIFPRIGASVFSLALAALFIIGGFQKILLPWTEKIPADKFTIMTGLVSLLLGFLLLALWPVERFSMLGVLVGIEILLNGMTFTLAGRAVGRMHSKTS
ncbi:MAG: DUF308 domain-containing protein [Chitinispirillaceae bacterium]